ncbi:MAG: DUF4244 domain-containing protein [Actinomycetota bacterium]
MRRMFHRTRNWIMRVRTERGSITAEYTLVTLVAATIALLMLNWAKGGAVEKFFQTIFDKVVGLFS